MQVLLAVAFTAPLLLLKATAQNTTLDYPYVAPSCPDHVPLMFAYENNRCGCFESPEYGLEDGSPATACFSPVGIHPHGQAACYDLSATFSKCFIQCDEGYKLEGDKCVFDDVNGVKACECEAPLSFAYLDKPCACVESLEGGWPGKHCPDPVSGHGKGSCRTITRSRCNIQCNKGYALVGNTCVPDDIKHCTMYPTMPFLYCSQTGCHCHAITGDPSHGVECHDPVDGHGRKGALYPRDGSPTRCTYICNAGYKVEGNRCVLDSDPPITITAARACQSHVPLMFSFDDKSCGCFESPDKGSPGTPCGDPIGGGGKGYCHNATLSECIIQCDEGYKLDGENCVADRNDTTFYYEDCPHHLPGRYLTADPDLGCVCELEPSDSWCQTPTGGGKASCFHKADLSVVQCRPECPPGNIVLGNGCIPELRENRL